MSRAGTFRDFAHELDRGGAQRVLVIDEHDLIASGLRLALSGAGREVHAITGPAPSDVVAYAQGFEPQCVLMDICVGPALGSTMDLIGPLSSTGAQVVMLTSERRRPKLAECVHAGASGWIDRGAPLGEIHSILGRVLEGELLLPLADRVALLAELRCHRADSRHLIGIIEALTPREALVLAALIDGLNAEGIAEAHFVALNTVRTQIRSMLQKLGVHSQLAAVAAAGAHRHLLPCQPRGGTERRRAHSRLAV